MHPPVNNVLQLARARLGEEGSKGGTSDAVQVVLSGAADGANEAARSNVPRPSLALSLGDCVNLVVELNLVDVDLPGVDSQDRTVLLVELFNLENVLSS